MKILNIIFFLLIALLSFESKAQSFEGTIKFKTEIETYNDEKNEFKKELEERYGDSLLVSFSKTGILKREYLNSSYLGNHIQVYNPAKGILYLRGKNSLKLDSIDVKTNSIENLISKKKIASERILGLKCECYEYIGISKYNDTVVLNYCFSKKTPKINPLLFEKHIDFFLYDYFESSEKPYVRFIIKTDIFKIVQTATEIKEKQIENTTFEIK
ncbi:hypothetical protein [Flavobacterium sp. ACAM 123]|jgi:hypothetical protein|uniref:hypothetical protein n=1 Tax=Flavobacterium sp. ACAM 123 TaxID=1189620 RepID=UPI0002DE4DF7|nr:hypothetical protein [Flavobacterium sp. ACAM 123]